MSFPAEDAREELERLRKDEQPATASLDTGGKCAIPAYVPDLPAGVRITAEMKQLLSTLVTSDKKRVGFCGCARARVCVLSACPCDSIVISPVTVHIRMGGIGKTTISTWLVREDSTRKVFNQIVWIPFGQEPNLEKLQDLVHMELTGNKFEGDPDATERLLLLKQAMAGKNLLLVLDDLW